MNEFLQFTSDKIKLFSDELLNIWYTLAGQSKYANSKCLPSNNKMLKNKGEVI